MRTWFSRVKVMHFKASLDLTYCPALVLNQSYNNLLLLNIFVIMLGAAVHMRVECHWQVPMGWLSPVRWSCHCGGLSSAYCCLGAESWMTDSMGDLCQYCNIKTYTVKMWTQLWNESSAQYFLQKISLVISVIISLGFHIGAVSCKKCVSSHLKKYCHCYDALSLNLGWI